MGNNCDLNTDQINCDYHFGLNHVLTFFHIQGGHTEDEDRVGDGAPCRRAEYIMSYGRFHGERKCW